MNINSITPTAFCGLWEPVKKLHKETGVFYKNKVMYTLNECIYHPWENETAAEIAANTDKHFWGRSFSLMETYDFHHKNDTLQMNFIRIGTPIKRENAQELIESGFHEELIGGVPNDKDFWATYSNASYEPYDIINRPKEYIKEMAAKLFDITA